MELAAGGRSASSIHHMFYTKLSQCTFRAVARFRAEKALSKRGNGEKNAAMGRF
jgi:hypothetical protein